MGIVELIIILLTIAGLFTWNRSESRTDIRQMNAKLEANRNLIQAIHDEIKDFHQRLCDIEDKKSPKR